MEKIQDLKIVVEHMGKPPIASGIFEPWVEDLAAIAKNPTVYCKISELVTQANWEKMSSIEALGPLSKSELDCIFNRTARSFYDLD